MQAFFSSEGSYPLQFLVIFLGILVLFLVATMLFMRLSGRRLSLMAGSTQRGRQPRLGIVDIYELDRQRQLILLRRDNVEHLLLVGGPNDVVVERHIQRGAGGRYAPDASGRSEPDLGASDALEEPRTEPFLDSPAPPTFTMPEVLPPAKAGIPPIADRAPPLDPGLFEPDDEPAASPPLSPLNRLMRKTAPPAIDRRREAASVPAAPATDPTPTVATPVSPESPPVVASREPRTVDPAVLSDMARQLQVALKRPSSAVTPPPGGDAVEAAPAPAPAPRRPPEFVTPPRPDPVAAAMAAVPPIPPEGASAPSETEMPPARSAVSPVAAPNPPSSEGATAPKPSAPNLSVPVEARRSEAPSASTPSAVADKTGSQEQNPFSVEEIEAEFARLLGRPLDGKN